MQNDPIDTLLQNWSDTNLPDENKKEEILHNIFAQKNITIQKRVRPTLAVLAPTGALAALILCIFLFQPAQETTSPIAQTKPDSNTVQISLIVLKRIPGSETNVEFLEDKIFVAEKEELHELDLSGHKLFLWLFPLEKELYALDIALDKATETGIPAVPDKTQALHLKSNGDVFDVFVSVI
jgi:hypothetical protein